MTAAKPGQRESSDDISGPCRIRECGFCHGNIDLQIGDGPATPLLRCACPCHRDRIRVQRQA